MDTPTAISILQTEIDNDGAQIFLLQQRMDAKQVALDQLKGLLGTEQADIEQAVAEAQAGTVEAQPAQAEPASP